MIKDDYEPGKTQAYLKRKHSDRREVKTERRSVWDRRSAELRLAPGEFIFKEGDEAKNCYVVISGEVSIVKLIDNEYRELVRVKEGNLFGEMAVIDDSPRSASARAEDEVVVRELDQQQLQDYMSRSPEVAIEMMKRLICYVRTSNKALEVDVFSASSLEAMNSDLELEKDEGNIYRSAMAELTSADADNQYIIDEFQNPSDALIKRPLPPVIKRSFVTISLLFTSFIVWASLSIIDVTLTMPGKLSTTVPNIPMQAAESSVVKTVHIIPGQELKKGDVIATLDPTISDADYNKLFNEFSIGSDEIRRIKYEISGGRSLVSSGIKYPVQQQIFRNRSNEYRSEVESLEISINKAKSVIKTSQGNLTVAELSLRVSEQNLDKQDALVQKGFMHERSLEELKFALNKAQSTLNNAKINLSIAKNDRDSAEIQKQTYLSSRLKQLNQELSEALLTHDGIEKDLLKLERKRENVLVKAPVDGVVLEMDKLFSGAIVNVGDVLAVLVPTNVPLVVEMDIDPKSITNVVVGHEVSVKLTALPYQKHGDLKATINYISENTVTKSINGEAGVFYRARATIDHNRLTKIPKDFRLQPGTQVQGDILTGKRRLITYFLYPVIRTLDTSFVEP